MPQNTDYKDTNSENKAISYRNRLNGWAIARVAANQERVIVARFRSRSDADGYIQHLRQMVPDGSFEIVFDSQREEVTI
ncbi:hypothetical protein A0J48_002155 [Sphaerospermopsis aphanizomenoides BCCUSP55]|uniref:hypothetical protein n=1 Tax=Sphaerospermopsis aphanizomenoides TaxID=459663 RepID=UPI000AC1945B|nr:hypothetical protein [Sphaerospermopsis aphanizomenoides]MBK1986364.1 hypothetical protein [Sphaerospermopsis aphanizomenoides BCCUSP55]